MSFKLSAGFTAAVLMLGALPLTAQSAAGAIGAIGAAAAQSALWASNMQAASVTLNAGQNAAGDAEEEAAVNDYSVSVPFTQGVDAAFNQAFTDLAARLSAGAYAALPGDGAQALKSAAIENGELALTFDGEKVRGLLTAQGLNPWNGLDNPIIVWMSDAAGEGSGTLVSGQNLTEFASGLNQAAEGFSLRLMYPLMDLDDVTQVTESTVQTRNETALAGASARYGADYILSAAVSEDDSGAGLIAVKWDLLDKNGTPVGSASLEGESAEVAATMAGDLARTLANQRSTESEAAADGTEETEEVPLLDAAQSDAFALGPYRGLVRVRISGVENLADLNQIKRTLIIYGYEDTVNVTALDGSEIIMEIPSSSDPLILDGSMARAQDFIKEGPWTYRWQKSAGPAGPSAEVGTVGLGSSRSAGSVSRVQVQAVPAVPAAPAAPASSAL